LQINLKQQKNELREHFKKIRGEIPTDEKRRLDNKITNRIIGLWAFRECELFVAYVSKPIEVDTIGMIEEAWRSGKRVAVPRCITESFEMEFYYIDSYDDLISGPYGLKEPDPEKCELVSRFSDAFCVVPSIAFDTFGYRLGFGKGYYDRFLSKFDGKKAGACYSSCLTDSLPHGKYDRKADLLATENKLYVFK
jgi:5-formyltetrahydrofolate cyclo-ligase